MNFSCIQMFFTAFVFCILRLLKLKPEGQAIYRKPHCKFTKLRSKFSLIPSFEQPDPGAPFLGLAKFVYIIICCKMLIQNRFVQCTILLIYTKECRVCLRFLTICLHTFQAKKYSPLEKECETKECKGVFGLELTKCTRQCISQVCYDEMYAWDEVRLHIHSEGTQNLKTWQFFAFFYDYSEGSWHQIKREPFLPYMNTDHSV